MRDTIAKMLFSVAGQAIPTVMAEPVKCLGRVYVSLTDKTAVPSIQTMTASSLLAFKKSKLMGKFKL